jgi:hypothetical protein
MNWVPIAVGAGAGVIAVLISAGIMKLIGKPSDSKGARVLYFLAFFAFLTLGRELVQPRVEAHAVEAGLLELPLYRALKDYEPQTYQQVLKLLEDGIATRQPQEQVWAKTRPLITEVATGRLLHASDEVQMRFAQHTTSAVTALYERGDTTCFSYINPAPGEAINFVPLFSPEIVKRELDLLSEIVVSAAGQTRTRVSEDSAAEGLQMLFAKLQDKYSADDLTALADPKAEGLDKRKFCLVTADLFRTAVSLPAPHNANVIRLLLQG